MVGVHALDTSRSAVGNLLRRDDSKHYSWPSYLATLRARHSCPVILLVVCANDAVARWCSAPIELGHPGWTLRPLVLGPSDVPVITGEMEARNLPELAVLSALAHGNRLSGRAVVSSAFVALDEMDDNDHAKLYADVIVASLTAERLRELEEDMAIGTYEPKHELFQKLVDKGRAEGEAKGEAKSLLRLLALRGIDVPTEYRHRITMCGDSDQLQVWFERAFTATQINDVFRPDS